MSIERDSDYYDKIYLESEEYRKSYSESKYFELWKRVLLLIPKTSHVLDVGCGCGQFAEMIMNEFGCNTYAGYDISKIAIQIAKSKGMECSFTNESLYYITYSKEEFIVCMETLEHIDDFKFIQQIPMGVEIVFTVPDFADAAHVRYFKNITEIVHRYERHIDFSHIEKFESWFVCKGVRI